MWVCPNIGNGVYPKFAIKEWEYGGKTLELGVPRFQTNPYFGLHVDVVFVHAPRYPLVI